MNTQESTSAKTASQEVEGKVNKFVQLGINMVDLMMWLVIAALLLAAALQSIAYYQKTAAVHTLKNDINGAVSLIHAKAAMGDGKISADDIEAAIAEVKLSRGNSIDYGTASTTTVASSSDTDFGIQRVSSVTPMSAGAGLVYVLSTENENLPDVVVHYFLEAAGGYDSGLLVSEPGEVNITSGTATAEEPAPSPSPEPTTEPEPVVVTSHYSPIPFAASLCQTEGVALNTVQNLQYYTLHANADCPDGPSGTDVPGGIAPLAQDASVCGTTVDTNIDAQTTAFPSSGPANCVSQLTEWINTIEAGGTVTIKVPVYGKVTGADGVATADISYYADFNVTGWRLTGASDTAAGTGDGVTAFHNTSTYAGTNSCTMSCRGLIGSFTNLNS